jgi:branched-subunit amino acid transport protein AzlD
MHDPQYVLAAVLVAAAITWALRAVPFALLAPLRHSELIRFLSDHSPGGVMIALVGYTVRNVAWLDPAIALPILVSGAITAGPPALAVQPRAQSRWRHRCPRHACHRHCLMARLDNGRDEAWQPAASSPRNGD